ncbi:MAG: NADP-dependent oxidoreductase [Spirochaetales bacterium]|nr:NADP-dependent oxidoreductase [Spirochaetales bacterium]
MKAIVYRKLGPADVLQVEELPDPLPAAHQLQIQVRAIGTNPVDFKLRSGTLPLAFLFAWKLPFIPGAECSGIVSAVGAAVRDFVPGDRVVAFHSALAGGAYAEKWVVDQKYCLRLDDRMDFATAAAFPLAGLTALQLLDGLPGAAALVYGASGGVGHLALGIARQLGFTVTAVASKRNGDFLRELGADHVMAYDTENFGEGAGVYDVFLDAVAAYTPASAARFLRPRGAYLTTLPHPLHFLPAWRRGLKYRGAMVQSRKADLARLQDWIVSGKVKVHVDQKLPLAEAKEAHRLLEQGRTRGKIVLLND